MLKIKQKLKPGEVSRYFWEIEYFREVEHEYKPLNSVHLNLGCGDDIRYGYINCDKIKTKGVDILLDLDKPLPFKNNSVDAIKCDKVITHLKYPLRLKKEIDRVLKVDGEVYFTPCTCNSEHRHNKGGVYRKVM